jgi:hypothetical protein
VVVATEVARLYRALIRARLRGRACERCGHSLELSSVVTAGEGTTLEEYGLSETAAAHLLAATEILRVQCDRCGATSDVGTPLTPLAETRVLSAEDQAQWSSHAVSVYRAIIHARLQDRVCSSCGGSLQSAKVERAAGGATLPEFGLDEDAAVALIAWMQCLTVRCPQCEGAVDIR